MVEERSEVVYDIGYGYSNPCRYLQEAFKGFLKCLGLYTEQKEKDGDGNDDGGDDISGDGGGDGREVDDPSIMDPIDEPISSATGIVTRRVPPRRPISSGGPGQTN
ncbi:uncharacterized protein [Rutidosis leptorrhynchoides]|uniref:uncharacterized protein isoform X2 n=1 Tax=Rutidosis leptorrhynchoides TaxID=125765 RepID=UPI003A9A288B